MTLQVDEDRLDDPAALAAADPQEMLRQVAESAATVRRARLAAVEANVSALADFGRPRAVVVIGTGEAALAGRMLSAICGDTCPVPVITLDSYRVPGWVGVADLVFAASSTGHAPETLAAAEEVARRGCPILGLAPAGTALEGIAAQARGLFVPVPPVATARVGLWGLLIPMLLAAAANRLVELPDDAVEAAASTLEDIGFRCRPASESFVNPGKQLALQLGGSMPLIWASSALAGTAAARFAAQLNVNAKYPAMSGELPAIDHDQLSCIDGPLAAHAAEDDFFADRVERPAQSMRLRIVMLKDAEEDPRVAARRQVSLQLAEARAIPVSEIGATGDHRLERLASMVGIIDFATVYLALAMGIDPTPVTAITELRERIG